MNYILSKVGTIRQHLAEIYEREGNWRQAALVLIGIPLETGQKQYSVDYKLETYLKIARLCLEDEDPVQVRIEKSVVLPNLSSTAYFQGYSSKSIFNYFFVL
jgi:hypothetical protein